MGTKPSRLTPNEKRAIADRVLDDNGAAEVLALYRLESPLYAQSPREIEKLLEQYTAAFHALRPANGPGTGDFIDQYLSMPPLLRELRSGAARAATLEISNKERRGTLSGKVAERFLVARSAVLFLDVTGDRPTVNGHQDETPYTIVADSLLELAGARVGTHFVVDTFQKKLGLSGASEATYEAVRIGLRFVSAKVRKPG